MTHPVGFGAIYSRPAQPVLQNIQNSIQNVLDNSPELAKLPAEKKKEAQDTFLKEAVDNYNALQQDILGKMFGIKPEDIKKQDAFMTVSVTPTLNEKNQNPNSRGFALTGEDMKAVLELIESRLKK